MPDNEPTVEQICSAPELAPLAILERALDITLRMLVAAYPEIDESQQLEILGAPTLASCAARSVADNAVELRGHLRRYRQALDDERALQQNRQLPF